MTDIMTEVVSLESEIKQLDVDAGKLEAEARAKRGLRLEKKARLSELQLAVNQAVSQQSLQTTAQAAEAARQSAEAAKTEAIAMADAFKGKLSELDALIAKHTKMLDEVPKQSDSAPPG